MYNTLSLLALLLSLFTGCQDSSAPPQSWTWQTIQNRAASPQERFPLYRIRVPSDWDVHYPPANTLTDTTVPLCTLSYNDTITLFIHNFPVRQASEQIAPHAQLLRWQRQLDPVDQATLEILPQSFSGFVGLYLHADSKQPSADKGIRAWSLQLAPEHFNNPPLAALYSPERLQHMRADVTLKAVGDPIVLNQEHDRLWEIVRSFELIDELPSFIH